LRLVETLRVARTRGHPRSAARAMARRRRLRWKERTRYSHQAAGSYPLPDLGRPAGEDAKRTRKPSGHRKWLPSIRDQVSECHEKIPGHLPFRERVPAIEPPHGQEAAIRGSEVVADAEVLVVSHGSVSS